MTGLVHPGVWIRSLSLVDDLVLGIADVAADGVEQFATAFGPVHDGFESLVPGNTDIGRRNIASRHAIDRRDGTERGKNIVALLVEPVVIDRETILEELGLQTNVILSGTLPSDVRIAKDVALVWLVSRLVSRKSSHDDIETINAVATRI